MTGAAKCQRISAARDQVDGLSRLGIDVVVAGRDEQLQAGIGETALQRVDGFRKDRVVAPSNGSSSGRLAKAPAPLPTSTRAAALLPKSFSATADRGTDTRSRRTTLFWSIQR